MVRRRTLLSGVVGGIAATSLNLHFGGLVQTALAAGEPIKGGTLNVGLHIPLTTLDWQSTVSHPLPHVMGHVFEGLFGFGKDFNAELELAESVEAATDGKTWTIKLRPGVKFHNGEMLKSSDVKASLERWRTVGPKGSGLNTLGSIDLPDDLTVVMNFDEPMGRFLLLLLGSDENKAVIMPQAIAEASTTPGQLTEVVGTGPYRFVEYKEDQYARLARFDDYVARDDGPNYQTGKKVGNLDEIIFWIVPEATTRVAGLESGEYDIITEVPDGEATRLEGNPDLDAIKNGPGVLLYMMFNHKVGPTSQLNIRKAIQSLIDPSEIAAAAVSNPDFALTNPSIYAPESAYNTDAGSELYTPGDIDKAKEYLAEANYNGEPVTIQVIATNSLQNRLAVAIVEQAKRAGLNLEILSYDLATWVANRRDPEKLNIYTSGGYWVDPSLWNAEFNGTFPSPEVGFISDATEKIFNELSAETEFEKRKALGEDLQREFYSQVAMVNLGYVYRLVAKRSNVMDPDGNLALGNLTLNGVYLDA
ncbi:ABC transporter substrate-binding protein [Devosia rhodophyticola]|uniref:ABC transporter substrate-binding protein n=1 Tax=Devosia rhodophyticola TaxID=3026423 RepID=A0ABY7YU63_9HYPH|nr:ABC transporter substrate-binding protein [Devosia rhodophyticola]WDR04648.1 ABC transporter substrate-binding protein [Devosia rhodophyticola]